MSLTFDLTSVLQLLGSVPADSKKLPNSFADSTSSTSTTTTTTTAVSVPTENPPHNDASERRLGDFSSLWSYLSSSKSISASACIIDGHIGDAVHDNDNNNYDHDHSPGHCECKPSGATKIKAILRRPGPVLPSECSKVSKTERDAATELDKHSLAQLDAVVPIASAKSTKKKSKVPKSYTAVAPPPALTSQSTPKKSPEKASLHTPKSCKGSRPTIKSTIPSEERKLSIIQKLLDRFPQDNNTLLQPVVHDGHHRPDDIHVFVDNSNILISFADYIKETRGFHKFDLVRRPSLSFHGLSLVLERGRRVTRRVLAGSSPVTKEIVEAGDLGYETCILDRVEKEVVPEKDSPSSTSSGSETSVSRKKTKYVEQGVDELLHMKMLESIIDYEPSTVVLASGDGAPAEFSMGFFHVILRYLMLGWTVEVVAFRKNLNKNYRDTAFRRKWGDKFKLILLDDYAEELLM